MHVGVVAFGTLFVAVSLFADPVYLCVTCIIVVLTTIIASCSRGVSVRAALVSCGLSARTRPGRELVISTISSWMLPVVWGCVSLIPLQL
jgi:hypothetical protein